MRLYELFDKIKNCNINLPRVEKIEQIYNVSLPDLAKGMISLADEPIFVEDYRILSYKEIQDADEELHVQFVKERIIPFIDCMDNDFIVYDILNKAWTKYNIVEELQFGEITELEQLMK